MKNILLTILVLVSSVALSIAQPRSSSSSSSSSSAPQPTPVRRPIGTVQPETVYVERPASQGRIQPETVYVERPPVQQSAPRPATRVQPETVYVERPPANRIQPETIYVDPPTKQKAGSAKTNADRTDRGTKNARATSYEDSSATYSANYNVPTTDYRRLIMPEDSFPADFEERLVQTAWKNLPINRGLEAKLKQTQEYHLQTRRSWFTDIVFFAQTNFTDYGNGAGARPTISAAPSGLGAGLSFNLGQFVNYGSRVRNSREGTNIAQADLNYQKHFMRSETIKRYQSFLMYKNLTKSETELANEQEMTLKVMKLNFETGQVAVEEFAKIQKAYADAAQLVITSRHNMFMAKAYLEEWIGVKLEEVK